LLESVVVVAVSLVLGGVVLLFADNWFNRPVENQVISYPKALKIGFFQVISMIPGVSRAAATIIGGLSQGLSCKMKEFSRLAVHHAGCLIAEMYKTYRIITADNIRLLLLGNAVALVAMLLSRVSYHFSKARIQDLRVLQDYCRPGNFDIGVGIDLKMAG
jgi:undecaprenyl-diphosphatase